LLIMDLQHVRKLCPEVKQRINFFGIQKCPKGTRYTQSWLVEHEHRVVKIWNGGLDRHQGAPGLDGGVNVLVAGMQMLTAAS